MAATYPHTNTNNYAYTNSYNNNSGNNKNNNSNSNNNEQKNIFATIGALRVSILEAIDVIDPIFKKSKKYSTGRKVIYLTILITDELGGELYRYNTSPQFYLIGDHVLINEEFIFDTVSSTNEINISINIIDNDKGLVSKPVQLGLIKLPISRLEENRMVST